MAGYATSEDQVGPTLGSLDRAVHINLIAAMPVSDQRETAFTGKRIQVALGGLGDAVGGAVGAVGDGVGGVVGGVSGAIGGGDSGGSSGGDSGGGTGPGTGSDGATFGRASVDGSSATAGTSSGMNGIGVGTGAGAGIGVGGSNGIGGSSASRLLALSEDNLTPTDIQLLVRLCMTREGWCDDEQGISRLIGAMVSAKARLAQ